MTKKKNEKDIIVCDDCGKSQSKENVEICHACFSTVCVDCMYVDSGYNFRICNECVDSFLEILAMSAKVLGTVFLDTMADLKER